MLDPEPVTDTEAQMILHEVRTNGRNLPLFSSYMTAEDITKIRPFAHDASRSIYYINYWYGEHALAPGPDHVLWLNRSPAKYTTIYENPHVSAWYFLDLAPHQLSVDTTALLLSLTIPLRPVTSRLVRHGDDIPRIPDPPPPDQIPEYVRADEPARRHAVTAYIHAPQLRGRILRFWIWQQSAGLVFRFRVLIDQDMQRLIIARRRVGEAVGNLTMPL